MTVQTSIAPVRSCQILVWESGTRLEAGLKRELFQLDRWPDVRACRSAEDVLSKREPWADAVLVLDSKALTLWIEANRAAVERVRREHWTATIAVLSDHRTLDPLCHAIGITRIAIGPIHDGRLTECCLAALRWEVGGSIGR